LEGVDVGPWWSHPAVQEVATTDEEAGKLVGYFDDRRAARVRTMARGDRPVQKAVWSERWPMRVLIVDELASLTIRATRESGTS
jgi:hypothetical protein